IIDFKYLLLRCFWRYRVSMLKKIYDISPIFLQNLLISIKGKQLEKERYNKHYYQEFKLLKNNEDSHLLQKEKLNQFIKYVKKDKRYITNIFTEFNNKY